MNVQIDPSGVVGAVVRLVDVGPGLDVFVFDTDGVDYALVELKRVHARRVHVVGDGSIGHLILSAAATDVVVRLSFDDEVECNQVSIETAIVDLGLPVGLRSVALCNAAATSPHRLKLDRLTVEGRVVLNFAELFVERTTVVGSHVTIVARRDRARIGLVEAGQPVVMNLHGTVSLRPHALPARSLISLNQSDLVLAGLPSTRPAFVSQQSWEQLSSPARRLHLAGRGTIRIETELEEPNFVPDNGLDVTVASRGALRAATWRVAITLAASEVHIQGARQRRTLQLTSLGTCDGARFDNVDLFLLDVASICRLRNAAEVLPWFPGVLRLRRRQVRQATGGRRGRPDAASWRSNTRYWEELSRILRQQNAPGSMQSNAHVALMRARTHTFDPRVDFRGWMLSRAYALAGYGERILLPTALWVVCAAVLAGVMSIWQVVRPPEAFWRLWLRVLAAPLSLFHADQHHRNSPGVWDDCIYAVAQLLGIVLIGLALLALRRVMRPKSDE